MKRESMEIHSLYLWFMLCKNQKKLHCVENFNYSLSRTNKVQSVSVAHLFH